MTVELNGIAHIQLTVNDPDRCCAFWEKLCHFFEMKTLIKAGQIVTAVDNYFADILVEDDGVSVIGRKLDMEADRTIDSRQCCLLVREAGIVADPAQITEERP